jgi:hypothetical protein
VCPNLFAALQNILLSTKFDHFVKQGEIKYLRANAIEK